MQPESSPPSPFPRGWSTGRDPKHGSRLHRPPPPVTSARTAGPQLPLENASSWEAGTTLCPGLNTAAPLGLVRTSSIDTISHPLVKQSAGSEGVWYTHSAKIEASAWPGCLPAAPPRALSSVSHCVQQNSALATHQSRLLQVSTTLAVLPRAGAQEREAGILIRPGIRMVAQRAHGAETQGRRLGFRLGSTFPI